MREINILHQALNELCQIDIKQLANDIEIRVCFLLHTQLELWNNEKRTPVEREGQTFISIVQEEYDWSITIRRETKEDIFHRRREYYFDDISHEHFETKLEEHVWINWFFPKDFSNLLHLNRNTMRNTFH